MKTKELKTKELKTKELKTKKQILTLLSLFTILYGQLALAVSCGDSVTNNVTLTGNLHCSTGFAAMEVFADNITIDLNGFTLSGTSDLAGILNSGYKNLEVKNGTISGFWAGVNTARSDNLKVHNTNINNVGHAVVVSASNNAQIFNNDFILTTSDAVYIRNSVAGLTANNNMVKDNEFYKTRTAIQVCGDDADFNVISNNLIWQSPDYGIYLNKSSNNRIINNTILDTGNVALRLNDSSLNVMKGNSLREGRVGLAILANASTACLNTGRNKSFKNRFTRNHSIGFVTGVVVGLGSVSSQEVFRNRIMMNKLYNNDLGIFFNSDAHRNSATSNAYYDTTVEIEDVGLNNIY